MLGHLGVAGAIHAHLNRIAIAVRFKRLAKILHRGRASIGINAKVTGHGLVIVFNLVHVFGGFGQPGIVRIFLAAQMSHPGSDAAGAGHPQPACRRHVDILSAGGGQLAGGFVLVQLGQVHRARTALEMGNHEEFVANRNQRAEIIVHGNVLGTILVFDGLALFIEQQAKNTLPGLVAAAEDGIEADRSALAVHGYFRAGQNLALLFVCCRKGHGFEHRHR